ncbi:MAG: protein translocase subunit SecF [Candidatus Nealsonbacteria bacterium]|nr:protein translocase subunit SecF [Candidatus Nealsonbacteria bacterium]
MNIPFIKYRNIYFIFSGILLTASIIALLVFGLRLGIDFTGGSILEIEYQEEIPSNEEIREKLIDFDLGVFYIQPSGERGVILKMKEINEERHRELLEKLQEDGLKVEEKRFELTGPAIGRELKSKTKIVIILALLAMIIYIALAFRRIQKPLRSWQYGITSVLALSHDVLIPLGVFAVLGKFYGVEISIPIITALLAVLGYSINNTVVVFDRIRENLLKRGGSFEEAVDESLNQTLVRQINTSLTTLFVSAAIFFFGGATLKYFSLALILGILAGTYSSIFLAAPILVTWFLWRRQD